MCSMLCDNLWPRSHGRSFFISERKSSFRSFINFKWDSHCNQELIFFSHYLLPFWALRTLSSLQQPHSERELWSLTEVINWERLWIFIETFLVCRGTNPTAKDGFHSSFTFLTSACWMHTDSSCDREGFRFRKWCFELLIPHCI